MVVLFSSGNCPWKAFDEIRRLVSFDRAVSRGMVPESPIADRLKVRISVSAETLDESVPPSDWPPSPRNVNVESSNKCSKLPVKPVFPAISR
jgi:hypothetical protein